MKLTDDRNGLKIAKLKRFCAIKSDTCEFVNRRTVANIRRTEHAVMDCPQCLYFVLNGYKSLLSKTRISTRYSN